MKAIVFPGQGAQFVGMGKDLYDNYPLAKELFEKANEILGFRITDIMFEGTDEELKQTKVTQPAVFLHSVIKYLCLQGEEKPDMVAGHSLGELSALVAAEVLTFEDGLRLVATRAKAMQEACDMNPGTMAAIIALPDADVENACKTVSTDDNLVIPANYNYPGQLVISGHVGAVEKACELLKEAGAKRALILPVSGAFHSPLMMPAQQKLAEAIAATTFHEPKCAIYQNVDGKAHHEASEIKENLNQQLTHSVLWTQEVSHMIKAGATSFAECGPGKALQGMIAKIAKANDATVELGGLGD